MPRRGGYPDQDEYAAAAAKREADEAPVRDGGSPAHGTDAGDPDGSTGWSFRRSTLWVTGVVVVVVVAAGAGILGYLWGSSGGSPADDSPEAGFARDMQVHHAQAVEMSFIIRDRSNDPTVRAVAYDIITSQQQQIGQMHAWLENWGLSQTSTQEPMEWMSGRHHEGSMPGMASTDELAQLKASSGPEAEALWLRLMITHHEAGIGMAEAVISRSDRPEVLQLARSMRSAQQAEIDQMRLLLDEQGQEE